jgi:hypothetical protein
MNDTAPRSNEQRQANLMALHRQLQEMAGRTKWSDQPPKDQSWRLPAPTLLVRGKLQE